MARKKCPYCGRELLILVELKERTSDNVRIAVRKLALDELLELHVPITPKITAKTR